MEIRMWPEAEAPQAVRLQVAALTEGAWPAGGTSGHIGGHDPVLLPVSVVLVVGGRVLAALAILSKELHHRGERYAASGLSSVVTHPAERRRGHGRRLLEAARDAMGTAGADLAIFTCDRPLAPFYESGGFKALPGTALVGGTPEEPLPSDRFDKVVIWCPYSNLARAHAADFPGARVELYPGTIDRLW